MKRLLFVVLGVACVLVIGAVRADDNTAPVTPQSGPFKNVPPLAATPAART